MKRAKTQSGQWGLISLLVTIAIIGIVAAIMYPKIADRTEYDKSGNRIAPPSPIDDADDSVCTEYQSQVSQAITMYEGDHGNRPPQSLDELKQYGVTKEIAETTNCNFMLPVHSPQAPAVAQGYVPTAPPGPSYPGQAPQGAAYPGQQGGYGGQRQMGGGGGGGDQSDSHDVDTGTAAGLGQANQMARYGVQASGGE